MIWVIIIVLIVAVAQLAKLLIINNIEFGNSIPVIENFFYIAHWQNKGAAWGLMQNGRLFFIPATIVISIVLVRFLYKYDNVLLRTSISMILGGAIGNLIDRIARSGGVVDFLDFYIGSYHFPTFNVADSFIVIGTFLLAYYMLFVYKEKTD